MVCDSQDTGEKEGQIHFLYWLHLCLSTGKYQRIGIFILVRRSRGNTGGVLGMCWDLDRQVSHPGCLGDGTYRTQERRRGRLISYTGYIYSELYAFLLEYIIGLGLLSLSGTRQVTPLNR